MSASQNINRLILQIPKELDERISSDILATLELEATLRLARTALQKMKYALDLVSDDLAAAEDQFAEHFGRSVDFVKQAEFEAANALDELQVY